MKPTLQMWLPICSRVWNRHPFFDIDKYHKFVYFHHADIQTTQDTGTDQVNGFLMCTGLVLASDYWKIKCLCFSAATTRERCRTRVDPRWGNKEDNRRSKEVLLRCSGFTRRLAAGVSIQDRWFVFEMSNLRTKKLELGRNNFSTLNLREPKGLWSALPSV